ncbi:hypothetical protein D9M71_428540 [compost metagenome]
MTAEIGYQQAAARTNQACQLLQSVCRGCEVVQHHVQHHAIGDLGAVVQGIGQRQPDIAQSFLGTTGLRQFQHRRAVVQRRDLAEAARQLGEESAVAGADLQRRGAGGEAQCVEHRQYALAILWQSCDQVLLGAQFFRAASEIVAADCGALCMHGGDTCADCLGQLQSVHFFEQRAMQCAAQRIAVGQGAAVEDRVAFAASRYQSGLGQHLQVVAHARLADVEDLRQFQHAERIVGQRAQYVQPQRIAAGLAQGGQFVAIVVADRGHAQTHKVRSLVAAIGRGNTCIKKF